MRTTEHQPKALRLAAWLEQSAPPYDPTDVKECAAELRRLQSENEALRARVARSDTPTGLQPAAILPAFIGTPKRKLDELLAEGFRITGFAIERDSDSAEPRRGFINAGGLVGWWWPNTDAELHNLRAQVEALTAERTVTHRKVSEAAEAMSWAMASCDLAGRSYFFERKLEGLRAVLANATTPAPRPVAFGDSIANDAGRHPAIGRLLPNDAPTRPAVPSLHQIMAAARAIHGATPGSDEWETLRQCEVDALRYRAEAALTAAMLAAAPQADDQKGGA